MNTVVMILLATTSGLANQGGDFQGAPQPGGSETVLLQTIELGGSEIRVSPPDTDGGSELSLGNINSSKWENGQTAPYPCRPLLSCRQVKGIRVVGARVDCFDRSWFDCTRLARQYRDLLGRWVEVLSKRVDMCKVPGACGQKACMPSGEQAAVQLCEREFD